MLVYLIETKNNVVMIAKSTITATPRVITSANGFTENSSEFPLPSGNLDDSNKAFQNALARKWSAINTNIKTYTRVIWTHVYHILCMHTSTNVNTYVRL